MKATFQDFLVENPSCSGLTDNTDAQEVFEILSTDENIIKMLELSDQNQPALAACVEELEKWHDAKTVNAFPFKSKDGNENFNKTAVGRMVKTVLAPFGYEVSSRKAISQKFCSGYFTSASCYKKTAPARLMVKKVITPVEL